MSEQHLEGVSRETLEREFRLAVKRERELRAEVERLREGAKQDDAAIERLRRARADAEALAEALQELIISIDGYVWKSLPKEVCDKATEAVSRYRRGEHG